MSREIRCPVCHCDFTISDRERDRIRCQVCGESFDAADAGGRTEQKSRNTRDGDDEPRPRRSSSPRRGSSNGGAGVAAAAATGVVVAILLICGGIGFYLWKNLNLSRDFKAYSPPGSNCSILMPGTPKEEVQNIEGMRLRVFAVENRRGGYGIAYADVPRGANFSLSGAVEGIANVFEGKVVVQTGKSRNDEGFLEFEVETKKPKGYVSGRVMLVRGRFYQFFAIGSDARLSNPDVKKFIESFKLDQGDFPWDREFPMPQPGNPPPPTRPNPPPFQPNNPPPAASLPNGELLGFSLGDVKTDSAPTGGILIGFEVWDELFINYHIVRSLRPIYRVGNREVLGRQFGNEGKASKIRAVAKEGYAVGAITARTTTGIEGMSITFMKVNGARLNPNDAYESEWLAGTRGSEPTPMAGKGAQVVGIRARENGERLSAVGLVFE